MIMCKYSWLCMPSNGAHAGSAGRNSKGERALLPECMGRVASWKHGAKGAGWIALRVELWNLGFQGIAGIGGDLWVMSAWL